MKIFLLTIGILALIPFIVFSELEDPFDFSYVQRKKCCNSSPKYKRACRKIGPRGAAGPQGPQGIIGPIGPTGPTGPCCVGTEGEGVIQAFGYFFLNNSIILPIVSPNGTLPIVSTKISTPNILNNEDGTYTIQQPGCYLIDYGCSAIQPTGTQNYYQIALAVVTGLINTEILNTGITSEVFQQQPISGAQVAKASGSVILPISAETTICVINNTPNTIMQLFPLVPNNSGQRDVAGYLSIKRVGDYPPP